MNIDLGPIIFSIVAMYASFAILVLAALTVGTWGVIRYVKKSRLRISHLRQGRPESLPHYGPHPQSAA